MTTRRLAAILAADMVGYSALMAADEAGTLARFKTLRRDLIEPEIARNSTFPYKVRAVDLRASLACASSSRARCGVRQIRGCRDAIPAWRTPGWTRPRLAASEIVQR